MDITAGLIAKGTLAASAVAGGSYLGYNNWDKIVDFTNTKILGTNDNRKINKKLKELGIEGCDLPNGESSKECTALNEEKLKKINFSNKDGGDLTVTGTPNVDLKIEKVSGDNLFTENLKFTFTSKADGDVVIKKESNGEDTKITLKKDIPYEFKLTSDNKLEKAWTLTTLGAKVNLTDCPSSASDSTCTFGATTSIWKEEGDYILVGAVDNNTTKKIVFAADTAGYFEGFKFTVTEDISLTGTPKKGENGIKKLTASGKSYEIGARNVNGEKKWFLIEKQS